MFSSLEEIKFKFERLTRDSGTCLFSSLMRKTVTEDDMTRHIAHNAVQSNLQSEWQHDDGMMMRRDTLDDHEIALQIMVCYRYHEAAVF